MRVQHTYIIAEAGVNHNGSLAIAKDEGRALTGTERNRAILHDLLPGFRLDDDHLGFQRMEV